MCDLLGEGGSGLEINSSWSRGVIYFLAIWGGGGGGGWSEFSFHRKNVSAFVGGALPPDPSHSFLFSFYSFGPKKF